ncbi:MAG: AAA family ATPase [Thermovenabulum sp.]|uniref:AAA family ATPase n=1 Tax=Thermovenabulum sp. TaxID=3100335 RepID=UPI003C7B3642
MAITVVIADDIPTTRDDIKRLLYFEEDIEVIGEAADGYEAVALAEELKPDVILMDINMPRMDGIEATERITTNNPQTAIVIISIQGENEYLKKAMAAGAREYLIKPFTAKELSETIRRVYESQQKRNMAWIGTKIEKPDNLPQKRGKIISFFSTKGGVGKTVVAVNLAMQLSKDVQKKVVLLDLDLSAGDAALMLNIAPITSIVDLVKEQEELSYDLLEVFLLPHVSGLKLLAAPERPEFSEYVTSKHVEEILRILKDNFDYIVVDLPAYYSDTNISVLEDSEYIILLLNQDITSLKRAKIDFEILKKLNLEQKVKVVLNKKGNDGFKPEDIEKVLGTKIFSYLIEDERTVVSSVNKGNPFVLSAPKSKIALSIAELSEKLGLR